MPSEYTEIFTQLPIVGIFVIFVLIWTDRMQKALDKRDTDMKDYFSNLREQDKLMRDQDRTVLTKMVDNMESLITSLGEHDKKAATALEILKVKTPARRRANEE